MALACGGPRLVRTRTTGAECLEASPRGTRAPVIGAIAAAVLSTVQDTMGYTVQVTVEVKRQWCARRLGSPVTDVLFEAGHLSQVVGFRLDDGREVVTKDRPWEDRLVACWRSQRLAYKHGFPCPRPILPPERIAARAVSVEEYLPGGEQLSPHGDAAELFAALLAQLIALTPNVSQLSVLAPSPPWVGWDHPGRRLWPRRDDGGADLNETRGPEWLDGAAARVRRLLTDAKLPPVLGHGDWESQNIRWHGRTPHAVHDWDSTVAQPEPAVVGAASAVWPAAGAPGQAATVEQSSQFIDAYQRATGLRWTRQMHQLAWATGLWVRAFNAKKDAADGGGPQLDLLGHEVETRLAQADV